MIEPVEASKLLPMRSALRSITASHAPGKAATDYDHPITTALVRQLPTLTYGQLEAARRRLMMSSGDDGGKKWMSNAVDRDGWLRLVNAEMQIRDRDRELAGESIIDFLTNGART